MANDLESQNSNSVDTGADLAQGAQQALDDLTVLTNVSDQTLDEVVLNQSEQVESSDGGAQVLSTIHTGEDTSQDRRAQDLQAIDQRVSLIDSADIAHLQAPIPDLSVLNGGSDPVALGGDQGLAALAPTQVVVSDDVGVPVPQAVDDVASVAVAATLSPVDQDNGPALAQPVGDAVPTATDAVVADDLVFVDDEELRNLAPTLDGIVIDNGVGGQSVVADSSDIKWNEDAVLTFRLNINDPDGDAVFVSFDQPQHGAVVINQDGTYSYTPDADYFGSDSFTIRIDDGQGHVVTRDVTLDIANVDDAAVVSVTGGSGAESITDAATQVTGTVSASDVDGGVAGFAVVDDGASHHGSLTIDANGNYTYVATNNNWSGSDSFTVSITDAQGGVTQQTVQITVTPSDDATIISGSVALGSLAEDVSITLTRDQLLANASDVDSALDVANVSATNGTILDNGDGTYTFTPTGNYSGTVDLSYDVVTDGGVSTPATASLDIAAVNDGPTNSGTVTLTGGSEDGSVTISKASLLANAGDVDGDALTASSITANHGVIVDNGDGTITFTPDANFHGEVEFGYTISDGQGGTVSGTASLDIAAVNDGPVAADDAAGTVDEDHSLTIRAETLLGNDQDTDGDVLSITGVSMVDPSQGTVTLGADGNLVFTPGAALQSMDTGQNATVQFTYTVSDGHGGTQQATATITVTGSDDNTAPTDISVSGSLSVRESVLSGGSIGQSYDPAGTVVATLTAQDADVGDTQTFSLLSGGSQFEIVNGNQLVVKTGAVLDYETSPSIDVTVRVTDQAGSHYDKTITVNVQDYEGAGSGSISGGTVTGTSEEDVLTDNSSASNVLSGGGGDDIFKVSGDTNGGNYYGADSFFGGTGNDTIQGSSGNDTIHLGGYGKGVSIDSIEVIDGGAGTNVIVGTAFSDAVDLSGASLRNISRIAMDGGNDTVIGTAGDDTIDGGSDGDYLVGGDGNDVFVVNVDSSGSGYQVDAFVGGNGVDTVLGGDSNDIIRMNMGGSEYYGIQASSVDVIDGGAGYNILGGSSFNDKLDLSNITVRNIDLISGDGGADSIIGTAGDDTIDGGSDADYVVGGAGNDVFLVNGDSSQSTYLVDAFVGGDGTDTVLGGAGNDTIRLNMGGAEYYGAKASSVEVIDGGAGYNVLGGSAYSETIDLSNVTVRNINMIAGDGGVDTIIATAGDDTISGGSEGDYLSGGDGNDVFLVSGDSTSNAYSADSYVGGSGMDTVLGGSGDDLIRMGGYGNASSINSIEVIDGGAGTNTIGGTEFGDRVDLTGLTVRNIASIATGNGSDTIIMDYGQGIGAVNGGNDSDTLRINLSSSQLNSAVRADLDSLNSFVQNGGQGSITLDGLGMTISNVETLQLRLDGAVVGIDDLRNHAPIVSSPVNLGDGSEGRAVVIDKSTLLANATDSDGDTLSVANITANHGTVVDNGDGTITFTPDSGYRGTVQFSYSVGDGAASVAGTASMTLQSVAHGVTVDVGLGEGTVSDGSALGVDHVVSIDSLNGGIQGSAGNDSITGTSANDTLVGGDGNDTLAGNAGNDVIYGDGSAASHTVGLTLTTTTLGADHATSYTISGLPSDAVLSAGTHNVDGTWTLQPSDLTGLTLTAHDGDGFDLQVVAHATDGTNLDQDSSVVRVNFGQVGGGDDTIILGGGVDTVYGGAGNDTFLIDNSVTATDTFVGGNGTDTIYSTEVWGSTLQVNSDLSNLQGIEVLDSNQYYQGTKSVVMGTSGDDRLDFSAMTVNNFVIDGGGGNDTVTGTGADDVIHVGSGTSTLNGGAGNDTFRVDNSTTGIDTFVGGSGTDTIYSTEAWGSTLHVNSDLSNLQGIEVLDSNQYYQGTKSVVMGTSGDDRLDFSDMTVNNFVIDGGGGNDTVTGTGGDDVIHVGSGTSTLNGGAGNDTFRVDNSTTGIDTFVGGSGTDTIYSTEVWGSTLHVNSDLSNLQGIEVLDSNQYYQGTKSVVMGTSGDDRLDFSDMTVNNFVIDGGGGNDTVTGTGADDVIHVGSGTSTLNGGAGNDTFRVDNSTTGIDTFVGGSGTDTIYSTEVWGSTLHVNSDLSNLQGIEVLDSNQYYQGTKSVVMGTSGDDRLDFSDMTVNNFVIDGGAGNDTIIGTSHADSIRGGDGNDTIVFVHGQGTADTYDGGSGVDTLRVDFASSSEISSAVLSELQYFADHPGTAYTFSTLGGLTVSGIENLQITVGGQTVSLDSLSNAAPVVSGVTGGTGQESVGSDATVVTGQVNASDSDHDALVYSVISDGQSHNGVLSIDQTGAFTFTASDRDWSGTDSFTVQVNDGHGHTVSQTVNVTVSAANDATTVSPIADQSMMEAGSLSLSVAGNFTDVDSTLTYQAALVDASGNVVGGGTLPDWLHFDSSTGVFSGTPATDDIGNVYLKVTASDGSGGAASDVFKLTVNDDPNVTSKMATLETVENTNIAGSVNTTLDASGSVTYSIVGGADADLFTVDSNGVLLFKTAANYEAPTDAGQDNVYDVAVKAVQGASSETINVSVQVNDVNEAVSYATTNTYAATTASNVSIGGTTGWSGNDSITAGDGYSSVGSFGGDDKILVGNANINAVASIVGGGGNDQIWAGDNWSTINLDRNSTSDVADSASTVNVAVAGSADVNDTTSIIGSQGSDMVVARNLWDNVNVGGGADLVNVGAADVNGTHGILTYDNTQATDGADRVYAGDNWSAVDTGAGNDVVRIGNADVNDFSTIRTGTGNDTIIAGQNWDYLQDDGGSDVYVVGDAALSATNAELRAGDSYNTSDSDTVTAGNNWSYISTGGAASKVTAGYADANDNSTIVTGAGNDTITAGANWDKIDAGAGDNLIQGGSGYSYVLTGNSGTDVVNVGDANVNASGTYIWTGAYGDTGADTVTAGNNWCTVDVGGGNDQLTIGNGDINENTSILLGTGNDTLVAGHYWDSVDAGAGNDYLTIQDAHINSTNARISLGGVSDTDNDTVIAGNNWATIDAGGGNDSITAGNADANDASTIIGGAGNDVINAGAYWDSIDGGSGADSISVGDTALSNTNAAIRAASAWSENDVDVVTAGHNWAYVDVGGGNNIVNIGNADAGDASSILAFGGNDTITAGSDWDKIDAGDGVNTIIAGAGSSSIVTGSGADMVSVGDANLNATGTNISTGSGDDSITAGNNWVRVDSGSGNDVINMGSSDANEYSVASLFSGTGNDSITAGNNWNSVNLGGGADHITIGDATVNSSSASILDGASGEVNSDTVIAGNNWSTVDVGAGDDYIHIGTADYNDTAKLIGGDGNDTIIAGGNWDSIAAGNGNDVVSITAGVGMDTIDGGEGSDSFLFDFGCGHDTVNGGSSAALWTDTIDLSNLSGVSVTLIDNNASSNNQSWVTDGTGSHSIDLQGDHTGKVVITHTDGSGSDTIDFSNIDHIKW